MPTTRIPTRNPVTFAVKVNVVQERVLAGR